MTEIADDQESPLRRITACDLCTSGTAPGECCLTPGCAFWMRTPPPEGALVHPEREPDAVNDLLSAIEKHAKLCALHSTHTFLGADVAWQLRQFVSEYDASLTTYRIR